MKTFGGGAYVQMIDEEVVPALNRIPRYTAVIETVASSMYGGHRMELLVIVREQ